ncbi:hypothetical protein GWI33_009261 [Rhynchophorus ferrugineus]|uniref:Uncharacterized protein n=1 Tax=Rhynchophorus ferrugineus TaxID=354439 RepID=A0A834IFJ2_RHYFE|nr:hypothetical protein GWI33_009261 [Rhynchophorus ferrugineus]
MLHSDNLQHNNQREQSGPEVIVSHQAAILMPVISWKKQVQGYVQRKIITISFNLSERRPNRDHLSSEKIRIERNGDGTRASEEERERDGGMKTWTILGASESWRENKSGSYKHIFKIYSLDTPVYGGTLRVLH